MTPLSEVTPRCSMPRTSETRVRHPGTVIARAERFQQTRFADSQRSCVSLKVAPRKTVEPGKMSKCGCEGDCLPWRQKEYLSDGGLHRSCPPKSFRSSAKTVVGGIFRGCPHPALLRQRGSTIRALAGCCDRVPCGPVSRFGRPSTMIRGGRSWRGRATRRSFGGGHVIWLRPARRSRRWRGCSRSVISRSTLGGGRS